MVGLARRWRIAIVAVAVAVLPRETSAQIWFPDRGTELGPAYLDVDSSARIHLQRADANLANGQWAEAVDVLQQVMQSYGSKLVELSKGHYFSVRTLCHMKIAALAPAGLAAYRQRADSQARRLYEQGTERRRAGPLRDIVQQSFCSTWGDDALLLLGELALEQGRYWQARAYWEKILPPDDPFLAAARGFDREEKAESPAMLGYPDSDLDPAAVRARLVLCLVLAGNMRGAQRELALLRREDAGAQGRLAGRDGPYAETLDDLIQQSLRWPELPIDPDWPMFAGNMGRNHVLPFDVEVGARVGTIQLRTVPASASRRGRFAWPSPRVTEDHRQPLNYFPALIEGKLIVNNGGTIEAYDPSTCKPLWGVPDVGQPPAAQGRPQSASAGRHTITVDGRSAYARVDEVGDPSASNVRQRFRGGFGRRRFIQRGIPQQIAPTVLKIWDLAKEGQHRASIHPPEGFAFEGSPIVSGGRIFVAMRRGGTNVETFVACYDDVEVQQSPGHPDRVIAPQLRWRQFVCQAATGGASDPERSHNLLTLADDRVYYCTNLGAVAALDARDGSMEWVFTYDRSSPRSVRGMPDHFARDLNPCLAYQGTIIAAPADTPEVFALDGATGRLRWSTPLLPDAVHLLGVGHGNLIASGRSIYFVDVDGGKVRRRYPISDDPQVRGYGRGILSGDRVYWPMRDQIWVFDQATAAPVKQILLKPHGETGGNLLVADGFLIVAQPDRLVVFSQFSRLFDRYRREVAERPDDGSRHYLLGRAAEATGRWELALQSYSSAARLAGEGEQVESQPLAAQAHRRAYALLCRRASDEASAGHWEPAVNAYRKAADVPLEPKLRLKAVFGAAQTWQRADRPIEAIRLYQDLLASSELAAAPLAITDRLEVPARLVVRRHIGRLIRERGPEVYAEFDQQAVAALNDALAEAESNGSESLLLDRFPASAALQATLLKRCEQYELRSRPAAAARLYKELLPLIEDPERFRILARRLAQAYEADGFLPMQPTTADAAVPDRAETNQQAARVAPFSDRLHDNGAALVPYVADGVSADKRHELALPMERKHTWALPPGAKILLPEGIRPTFEPRWVYLTVPEGLQCWSVGRGQPIWKLATGEPVRWIAYAGDNLLVSTGSSVASVGLYDGRLNWRHWLRSPDELDAFIPAQRARGSTETGPALLLHFPQLYCREANRLVALDARNGQSLWSLGGTGSEQLVGVLHDGTLVAHCLSENELLSIDPASGQVASRLPVSAGPWARPACLLASGRVCAIPNRQTVELYDLRDGRRVCQYREVSLSGLPEVFGDGRQVLLVLLGRRELVRLDPENGSELWRSSLDIASLGSSLHPAGELAFADETAFYYASDGMVAAVELEGGQQLWRRYAGEADGQWRVAGTQRCLIAYPVENGPSSGDVSATQAVRRPVTICERATGVPVQQWNLEGPGPIKAVLFGSPGAAIAGADRLWNYGPLDLAAVGEEEGADSR